MLKSQLGVMACVLGTIPVAGNACSSSVNALFRDGAGADAGSSGGGSIIAPIQGCPNLSGGPAGVQPLASPAQVAHQRTELAAFIHFGLGTFDGTEYGDASQDSPSLFNPTNLDATEWVSELQNAGFREGLLVTKHATGFCLWPSAQTDYSVKNSPWKNGQGDVVGDFANAMRAAGMRMSFYLSPWDEHYPSSAADYDTYFRNQLTELLTNYGPVYEIYFDGHRAPALDWGGIAQLAKRLQPNVLVWLGPEIATSGASVRWIGNQYGQGSRSTSSVADVPNDGPSNVWYPVDATVSDRGSSWFWHADGSVMTLTSLETVYFDTVGMNTTLVLNVPPATTGQFDTPDIKLLEDFGTWYSSLYKENLVRSQPATADSSWANAGFDAAKAVDDDVCTYWAAASGRTSARLEVTPASPITFQVISIREPIELGERSTGYHVEIKQNGTWNDAPTDASGARIQGTVIGQRQLWQLNSTTAEAVALVIDSAKDVPTIAEFSAY